MKIENLLFNNINFNKNNSGEELPFITISNSKSNSSKNPSSKNSSNNYKVSLTQNNNSSSNSKNNHQNSSSFNIIRQKLTRNYKNHEEKSSELFTLTDNSFHKFAYDISFNNNSNKYSNLSLSEDKKEKTSKIKIEKLNIKTPEKKPNYNAEFFKKSKSKNKAVLQTNNFNGKNLMDYFNDMSVNVTTEENNKNRVSSAEIISDKTLTLKNNFLNINKSWNKKNINNIQLPKNQIKNDNNIIKNKISKTKNKNENQIIPKENYLATFSGNNTKRSTSNLKISSIKNFQNLFKKNNIDFENLMNKYMPKKIKKINHNIDFLKNQKIFSKNNNNYNDLNKINIEKKENSKKVKNMSKTDSYKRKLSFSYVKIREGALKNLFHDYKQKPNENINVNTLPLPNKISPKVVKENKQIFSFNFFDKDQNYNNNKYTFIKTNPIKKELIVNRTNVKKINNCNDINSYFSKFKDKREMPKQNDKPMKKGFNYKNNKFEKI